MVIIQISPISLNGTPVVIDSLPVCGLLTSSPRHHVIMSSCLHVFMSSCLHVISLHVIMSSCHISSCLHVFMSYLFMSSCLHVIMSSCLHPCQEHHPSIPWGSGCCALDDSWIWGYSMYTWYKYILGHYTVQVLILWYRCQGRCRVDTGRKDTASIPVETWLPVLDMSFHWW